MRELEGREKKVNTIQATGDRLIKEGHPGKKTVEVSQALPQGKGQRQDDFDRKTLTVTADVHGCSLN